MSIGSFGRPNSSDQQIQLLQQQVADLQRDLAAAQQNLLAVQKLTEAWSTKLSSLHNTRFPTLMNVGGASGGKFVIQG